MGNIIPKGCMAFIIIILIIGLLTIGIGAVKIIHHLFQ